MNELPVHEPENEAQVFEYLTSAQHQRAEALFHQIKARLVQRHSPDERPFKPADDLLD